MGKEANANSEQIRQDVLNFIHQSLTSGDCQNNPAMVAAITGLLQTVQEDSMQDVATRLLIDGKHIATANDDKN
ncbi:hypothetical protein LROSL1_1164 [Furfurilactobacillus rossiae]|uniref:hypothetical protein n=1 Tax=Furfurilactobacillus rossiae TaxID=231049 RepID=UPI0015B7A41F|nr:hypothetical protein [Furfurilactobacillus rossiae]QLE63981.1 hypothetical protein LROSL1_1164 [Furfurilactobacillus rossiae]